MENSWLIHVNDCLSCAAAQEPPKTCTNDPKIDIVDIDFEVVKEGPT